MFRKRIGPHPHAGMAATSAVKSCPDIWELDNGSFAVIGVDKTAELLAHLPSDASCGSDERIVVIDRHVLLRAKPDIPEV